MISISNLKKSDIGRWVTYKTPFEKQTGRIKSWNGIFIFVVYKCVGEWDRFMDYTGEATAPETLTFIEEIK